jgi:hypothetical protein
MELMHPTINPRLSGRTKLFAERQAALAALQNDRVRSSVAAVVTETVADNRAMVIDTSHWSGKVTPEMLAGFDCVIAKMGGNESPATTNPYDSQWENTVQAAYDVVNADGTRGIACGGYWMVNPRIWVEAGVTPNEATLSKIGNGDHKLLAMLEKQLRAGAGWKAVQVVAFDIEEASTWISGGGKLVITDDNIQETVEDLRNRIVPLQAQGRWPKFELAVYGRASWFDEYDKGRQLRTWLENHPEIEIWTADYRVTSIPTWKTAADVRAYGMPKALNPKYPAAFGWTDKRPLAWSIWQYWGSGWADLNVYNGDKAALYKWLNYSPRGQVVTPPPPPPPTTDTEARLTALEADMKTLKEWRDWRPA